MIIHQNIKGTMFTDPNSKLQDKGRAILHQQNVSKELHFLDPCDENE